MKKNNLNKVMILLSILFFIIGTCLIIVNIINNDNTTYNYKIIKNNDFKIYLKDNNFYENNIKELFKIENVTIDDINNYRTTINNHFFISMEKFNIKSIRITVAKEKMYVIKYYEN